MLKKKTETEETRGFFVTFLSLAKFQLGRSPGLPLATPMLQLRKTKKMFAIFRQVAGALQQNFNG